MLLLNLDNYLLSLCVQGRESSRRSDGSVTDDRWCMYRCMWKRQRDKCGVCMCLSLFHTHEHSHEWACDHVSAESYFLAADCVTQTSLFISHNSLIWYVSWSADFCVCFHKLSVLVVFYHTGIMRFMWQTWNLPRFELSLFFYFWICTH